MQTWWSHVPVLALLLAITGCYTTKQVKVKPPKHEEAYLLPPANERRFDEPVKYPKETLNQDSTRKGLDNTGQPMPTMRGGPGGSRFGGAGMGPGGF